MNGTYLPYGEERTTTAQDRDKFATYYRDANGLDYADQRYYNPAWGRFLTADPLGLKAADPRNPGSWHRYAYVRGDPVSFADPNGMAPCETSIDGCPPLADGGGSGDFGTGLFGCTLDGTPVSCSMINSNAAVQWNGPTVAPTGSGALVLGFDANGNLVVYNLMPGSPATMTASQTAFIQSNFASALTSKLNLPQSTVDAIVNSLQVLPFQQGGHSDLFVTVDLSNLLSAQQLQNLQSTFGGDGWRGGTATNSAHIVLRSDGTFEGHVDCGNVKSFPIGTFIHAIIDVFVGTVTGLDLDKLCAP